MTDCFICHDGRDCEVNGKCPNCGRTEPNREKYFVWKFGRLYAGKENPNPEEYKEISYDTFCELLSIAEFAWHGWYNIYQNPEELGE